MQLAVDRAHGDQALGDARRPQYSPVEAHFPANRTVRRVEAEQLPVARARQHQLPARGRAAGQRCAGARAPQDTARGDIDGHDVAAVAGGVNTIAGDRQADPEAQGHGLLVDRKSTRLNSSHGYISYAVFCLKKKKMTSTRCTLSSTHLSQSWMFAQLI